MKLFLDLTLDSSEAIMFSKGGRHIVNLENFLDIQWESLNEVAISVQIEKEEMERYNFVKGQSSKKEETNETK
jgi:hypothetical protein